VPTPAAKGENLTSRRPLGRPGRRPHRRLPGRKLASGGISSRRRLASGSNRCKSQKALGMRRGVRQTRGGCAFHRWYTPGTGRYSRTDPLFFTLQDINPYGYVRSNPLFGTDPLGLQTYHCTRPLGKPPGPKTPPPIVNHQYACFLEANGTYTCDSTSKQPGAGAFFDNLQPGTGNNPRDIFDPKSCKQVEPPDTCLEDCLRTMWSQPRSTYAIGPAGEDCQEYTDRVLYQCRVQCGFLSPRQSPANPSRPGYRESPL